MLLRQTSLVVALTVLAVMLFACQVTPRIQPKNAPPQTNFQIVGDPGTPFNAVVTDTVASWEVVGTAPMTIGIINNHPPARMVATKLVGGNALMSLEVIQGLTISQLASTTDPFGSASVQTGGTVSAIAPRANPDVRFFVKQPFTEKFSGLIEDQERGFIISGAVPAVYLFENPKGRIDGQFIQLENLGNFDIDLIIGGTVVNNVIGGPNVTVKGP